jgi:hypothetical protein
MVFMVITPAWVDHPASRVVPVFGGPSVVPVIDSRGISQKGGSSLFRKIEKNAAMSTSFRSSADSTGFPGAPWARLPHRIRRPPVFVINYVTK